MLWKATVNKKQQACKIETRKPGDTLIGCFLMTGLICRMCLGGLEHMSPSLSLALHTGHTGVGFLPDCFRNDCRTAK